MVSFSKGVGAMGVVVLATGCGGGSGGTPNGTVSDLWEGYCTATFEQDFTVLDAFDEVSFTARAGDTYLISSLDSNFSDEATLLYLPGSSVEEFVVPNADPPFSTNCDAATTESYYAVFADVAVYSDEQLTTQLCELSEGQVAAMSGQAGYAATNFALGGPITYEVYLGGFSTECGASVGYVSVPPTDLWGSRTWLAPFRIILAPTP